MSTLFSYVVDHDIGFAPNPFGGYCTLVHCKYQGFSNRRNIVELADERDWILDTGGKGRESAGNNKIIYLMQVDEKLSFRDYLSDERFRGRSDREDFSEGNEFALVSKTFYYFGKNALDISELPEYLQPCLLVKKGPGFRSDYPAQLLNKLCEWFANIYEFGMHGNPCTSEKENIKPRKRLTTRSN